MSDEEQRLIEALKAERRQLDEERWKEAFGQLGKIQCDVTEIKTNVAVCRQNINEHHAILLGDSRAGSHGIVQKIDRLNGRMGLLWKSSVGLIGVIVTAYVAYRISGGR